MYLSKKIFTLNHGFSYYLNGVDRRKGKYMKYLLKSLVVLLVIIVGNTTAFAQDQAAIGKVTRLQGSATEMRGTTVQALQAGSLIHSGAMVETAPDSRLEIVFVDASQLTMGADARMRMDELVYSASNPDGEGLQAFEVFAGTFRFLSGAVGRNDPASVRISTPVATIGIRGTDLFGGPLEAGMPPGQLHYGFMIISGAIDIQGRQGTVTLDEPNEGTFLPMSGEAAPTEPSIWTQEAIDEAYASIAFQ